MAAQKKRESPFQKLFLILQNHRSPRLPCAPFAPAALQEAGLT